MWTDADEVILICELYLEPVPAPLTAWQRAILRQLFAGPAEGVPDGD